MSPADAARVRLANQQIAVHTHETPQDVVAAFGAMQAQEYRSALWAVGSRLSGVREDAVEQALAGAAIVRTWALRGTLHFVAAPDVRWILGLLAQRVIAGSAYRHRQLGIDAGVLGASRRVLVRALSDGGRLTRDEAFRCLESAGVATTGQRGIHILRHLSLDAVLVQTAFTQKQATFAILDEVVPQAAVMTREQALAELTRRYFGSHGPATLRDFAWWSGLTLADSRLGIELIGDRLGSEKIGDEVQWTPTTSSSPPAPGRDVHVLPGFDEYILGYADRSIALDDVAAGQIIRNGVFRPAIVVDGRAVGTWRPGNGRKVSTVADLFSPFDPTTSQALALALGNYDAFVKRPAASV
jgi:hypothetical protein